MKKGVLKTVSCIVLAVFMTAVCACSGDEGPDDPNLGVYVAKSAEMSGLKIGIEDIYEDGFKLELKKKGKATLSADGESGSMKWTLENGKFHAEGGGATFDGTLKDGDMVLENVMDSGMTLYLECDAVKAAAGTTANANAKADTPEETDAVPVDNAEQTADQTDEKEGGSATDKLTEMLDAPADAGKWVLFNVTEKGRVYMEDELKEKGIESWIEMNADGTGKIYLVGQLMDMEWDNGNITVPDNGEGEKEEYRYTISNEYLVLVDGEMVLTFMREDNGDKTMGSTDAGASEDDFKLYDANAQMSKDFMKRFEGDWHGLLMYSNAEGDTYKDYDGKKCDVIARICLDENGNVTNAFFCNATKEDPEKVNFRDVTAELDPGFDAMYISGKFLEGGTFDTEYVSEENGFLHTSMKIVNENGDSIHVEIGMKRPDAEWTDEDHPRYPDEGVEFYKGKSLEQVMSTFGNPPKSMPEQTHVSDWE